MTTKHFTIEQLFTEAEIKKAVVLKTKHRHGSLAKTYLTEIVVPVMERINRTTQQENDPMYMAYLLEYVVNQLVEQ